MDHEEEQLLELEALESIFLSDYSLVSETPPRVVELRLFPIPGEDADEENKVGMLGRFTLPATYPEVAPEVALVPLRGLTSKHCDTVLELLAQTAEASLGMPMIYTLAEAAKDWLAENNRDHTDESMHAQMMAKLAKAKDDEERQKLSESRQAGEEDEEAAAERRRQQTSEGTAVTKETFLAWEKAFVAEMRAQNAAEDPASAGAQQQRGAIAPDAELTGRQFFEQQALRAAAGGAPVGDGEEEGEEGEWADDIQEDLFLEGADDEELDALSSDDDDDEEEEEDDA